MSATRFAPTARLLLASGSLGVCGIARVVCLLATAAALVSPVSRAIAEEPMESGASDEVESTAQSRGLSTRETDLAIDAGYPVGYIVGFSGERDSHVYNIDAELDRHSWKSLLGARCDYVAELILVSLLRQPVVTDIYGDALSRAREWNPGIGVSPIGIRLLWKERQGLRPYFVAKPGIVNYSDAAMAPKAGHLAFIFQAGGGIDKMLTKNTDLRLGANYLHVSNGFISQENPGLDEVYLTAGFGFTLRKRNKVAHSAH